MKRKLSTIAAVAALAVAVFPVAGNSLPHQSADTVERSFDVRPGGTLEVRASFGSIFINSADADRVEARVIREVRDRYRDDTARILAEYEVRMAQRGDDVVIETEVSDDARDRWQEEYRNTPLRARIEITVPRSYNAELETRGGSVSVADLDGDVRSETAGGSLDFGNISGSVHGHTAGGSITLAGSLGTVDVHTSGGNIVIGEVDGDIDVETSGGSIRIERARGSVHAETSGGSITIEEVAGAIDARSSGGNVSANITRQPAADCRLSTGAGSVTVTLASDIAVDVDASTSIGGVSSDFDIDGRVRRDSMRGSINGGGPELYLRTSAGSIHIRER